MNFCNLKSIKLLFSLDSVQFMYIKVELLFFSFTFCLSFYTLFDVIDNKIYLYVISTTNLLILFCVWIEVRRVKRSQFDAVQMMLKRCMIRKVIMQSFHSCDNTLSNNHNRFTKKINDMSMSVRDEKILLMKKTTQMKSLQIVITSDWRIYNSLIALISKHLHHINSVVE